MMNRPNINVSQSSKIFIGNLPIDQSEEQLEQTLYELFSAFGEIADLFLVRNKETGRHRGFGFICFTTAEAAQNATALNDKKVFENYTKPLKVDPARERRTQPLHQNVPNQMLHHQTMAPPYPRQQQMHPGYPQQQSQQPRHNHNAQYQAPRPGNAPWVQQPYWETVDEH